jgi:hypothetical protein
MEGAAAERPGVADRLPDAAAELLLAPGQGGEAALAAGPVAGREVEQRLGQAVLAQAAGDRLGRVLVGEQELDAGEARRGRRREPVEEGVLLERHAEVGGEARHRLAPLCRNASIARSASWRDARWEGASPGVCR